MYASDILNLTFFPKGAILTFSSAAWSATSAEFKNIWKICNAANHAIDANIPDLTNRFLRGGETSDFTTGGGADSRSVTLQTVNLPSHSHGATGLSLGGLSLSGLQASEGGSHYHTLTGTTTAVGDHTHYPQPFNGRMNFDACGGGSGAPHGIGYGDNMWNGNTTTLTLSPAGGHAHGFSSDSQAVAVAGHTHTVTGSVTGGSISGSTATAGSGTPLTIDTLPSYYTVVYIMKVV
jgi:hypothetical protein